MEKKYGRHLSNIYNGREARSYYVCSHETSGDPVAREREWREHLAWIAVNVIGPPQATEQCTVKQLEDMEMVGIYAPLQE